MPVSLAHSQDLPEPGIMELSGHLDSDTSVQVEEDIMLCVKSGAREMLLDFDRVNFMTGAGLRALIRIARAMQETGGKLAICNLAPQARGMIEACGLDNFIAIYEDQASARLALAA